MVAETAPAKKPRSKPAFGPGNPIPLPVKLTIRSMYVLQGLQPSQIAPLIHLTSQQVAALVRREGWSTLRAEKRSQKESSAVARQDTRAGEEISRIHEAAAIRGEECMVKTLDHCANLVSAEAIDEKALQMASGAARNFVQVARMLRGMDSRGPANAAQQPGPGATLIFVGALERATPKELKPAELVQPAIEIPSSPVNT